MEEVVVLGRAYRVVADHKDGDGSVTVRFYSGEFLCSTYTERASVKEIVRRFADDVGQLLDLLA